MNVLVVHAHHEPASFCSALSARAVSGLKAAGHEVVVSDLHAMGFDPVSDRRNFLQASEPDYLKQQVEEVHASDGAGFVPDLEAEIAKLEACDALVFSCPLWWFGMPAILKGWCDRVLVSGRVYGGGKLYENGLGGGQRRAMIIVTTGGAPNAYDGWGVNPSLEKVLEPIQHGIFWFNGFRPLHPFVAYAPARVGGEGRAASLEALDARIEGFFEAAPLDLPRLADFPGWGPDAHKRFIVTAKRRGAPTTSEAELAPAQEAMLSDWRRRGVLLDYESTTPDSAQWRGFMRMRTADRESLERLLGELPLADALEFDVSELAPPFDSK